MAPRAGTEERYANQMGELWSVLTRTLTHLDHLAAVPALLEEDSVPETLRGLQYSLHTAGERVYGLAPPAGAEPAHSELWAAIAGARDATADVADAIEEDGADAVGLVIHEWRGALFRVRLARMQLLDSPPPPVLVSVERRQLKAPLLAAALVAGGATTFALGATTGHWPIWAAGMLAVFGSMLTYRP